MSSNEKFKSSFSTHFQSANWGSTNNTITELINTYRDNTRDNLKNKLMAEYTFEIMKKSIQLVNKIKTQMGGEREETKTSELPLGLSNILDEYVRITNNKFVFTKKFIKILRLTKNIDNIKRKAINNYVIKLYRFIQRVLSGKPINDTVKEHIKSIFIYYCKENDGLFPTLSGKFKKLLHICVEIYLIDCFIFVLIFYRYILI